MILDLKQAYDSVLKPVLNLSHSNGSVLNVKELGSITPLVKKTLKTMTTPRDIHTLFMAYLNCHKWLFAANCHLGNLVL